MKNIILAILVSSALVGCFESKPKLSNEALMTKILSELYSEPPSELYNATNACLDNMAEHEDYIPEDSTLFDSSETNFILQYCIFRGSKDILSKDENFNVPDERYATLVKWYSKVTTSCIYENPFRENQKHIDCIIDGAKLAASYSDKTGDWTKQLAELNKIIEAGKSVQDDQELRKLAQEKWAECTDNASITETKQDSRNRCEKAVVSEILNERFGLAVSGDKAINAFELDLKLSSLCSQVNSQDYQECYESVGNLKLLRDWEKTQQKPSI